MEKHPETRITWAHAGLSRYLNLDQDRYTDMLGDMLDRHDNLWIDLSWLVYEDNITDGKPMYKVKPCWLKLVMSFPDRFMIGSDAVGKFAKYDFNIRKYYTLLDRLPKHMAQKVAIDNYLSILPQRVQKTLAQRKA